MATNKVQSILDGLNDDEKAEMLDALKKVKPKKVGKDAAKAGAVKAVPTGSTGTHSRLHDLKR